MTSKGCGDVGQLCCLQVQYVQLIKIITKSDPHQLVKQSLKKRYVAEVVVAEGLKAEQRRHAYRSTRRPSRHRHQPGWTGQSVQGGGEGQVELNSAPVMAAAPTALRSSLRSR
jgi:hypothetical protein